MSNQFRWAALIALILITLGYGYYLITQFASPPAPATVPSAPENNIIVDVQADGSVVMNGERFSLSDPDRLKAKVTEIQKAHPNTNFHLRAARNMAFEPIGKAALLFQKSGAAKVAFITEPKNEPAK